jgi:cytochrome P450/ferredoxin-NADP reductase
MGLQQLPTQPFQHPQELFHDLAALRREDGVYYSTQLEAYVVTRYDDITAILDRPDVFSSRPTVPEPPSFVVDKIGPKCPMRGTLLGHDNPDHDRLRLSVNTFFVPRRLKRFEPLIENLAHELLDKIAAKGISNIKADFALPLPLKVISAVAGLETSDWQWVARSLSLFGGHHEFALETFEEKLDAIVDIHERIAQLIQLRRIDRRDDLISHIWDEREAGNVVMTDFEHLSMIPGLLLAGHETTTNLLSMGLSHLLHHGLWKEISMTDDTRAAALEELLRYESAITGMPRLATQRFSIGSTSFKQGDRIFLAYNSGSRDERYFLNGDSLDIHRKAGKQHLGFGRGIHACLGAPLARMLLQIELRVLNERLPGLRLTTSYNEIQYDHVHEGRGIKSLEVAWDGPAARRITEKRQKSGAKEPAKPLPARNKQARSHVVIKEIALVATDVLLLTLSALPGQLLQRWTPGSHIDIPVGKHGWRQYSLCSDPADPSIWQIAVLLEENGTGGSQHIHKDFRPGQQLTVGGPRNYFPLRPGPTLNNSNLKPAYLFIAGGIGITPIRSMISAARAQDSTYRALYLGSSRSRMAFASELCDDPNARIWAKDESGPFHLPAYARNIVNISTSSSTTTTTTNNNTTPTLEVYTCGPARLIAGVEAAFTPYLPSSHIHSEHFSNTTISSSNTTTTQAEENEPFTVLLRRSNRRLHVPGSKSLLTVLNENGTEVMSTCARGTCGTCEVGVLAVEEGGELVHRDTVLTREERVEAKSMMSCVSRCRGGGGLVLDLW